MLAQAILISFREGLESFLIVGVILAYLRRTGRTALVRGVQLGVALSVLTCTVGAYLWYRWTQSETGGPNQALYEGIAAFLAALLVGALLWQTLRASKHLRQDIEARVERAVARDGGPASWRAVAGIAAVTMLLVTREGLEAIFFLGVQTFSARAPLLAIGAAVGLALAALIAWSWSRFGYRLQMGLVLRVTSIFLGLFLAQLLLYGLHELAESGVIPGSGVEAFHAATERLGPQGDIGRWVTFSLVGAPLLYLLFHRLRARSQQGGPASDRAQRAAS